jgi:hypothetical protein
LEWIRYCKVTDGKRAGRQKRNGHHQKHMTISGAHWIGQETKSESIQRSRADAGHPIEAIHKAITGIRLRLPDH